MKKLLLAGAIAGFSFLNINKSNAQEVVTPLSKVYEVVEPANLHILEGKDSLDYYGSGDVILNDTISYADAQAIRNGTESNNERADVNGDGTVDNLDADLIDNFVDGTILYLPAHLSNKNMTETDRINWLENYHLNIDKTDTVRTTTVTWQCGEYGKNFLANTLGIINFGNYINYDIYENTIGNYSNMPVFDVSSYTYGDVFHAYNGMFKGGLSTIDFDNYYLFDSYKQDYSDLKPGDIQLIEGPITFSRFVYAENVLGEKVFTRANLIGFDMEKVGENYVVSLKGVSPKMLRVNPREVNLALSGLEDKEFNYEHDLEYANLGEVDVTTNLDLVSTLNTKDEGFNSNLIGRNFVEVSYEFSEKTPLYEDERGQYNYTLRRKSLVNLIQESVVDGPPYYSEPVLLPIMSDSIYQTITVEDLEAPVITASADTVEINENNFTTPEEVANYTITDNAEVKTVNYNSILEESNDSFDLYKVEVNADDHTGNVTFGESTYVKVNKPNGIGDEPSDLEKACGLTPYPNPNPYGIKYYQSDFGQTEISVYDMSGRKMKSKVYNSQPGENNIEYDFEDKNSPAGLYFIKMEAEGCKDIKMVVIKN